MPSPIAFSVVSPFTFAPTAPSPKTVTPLTCPVASMIAPGSPTRLMAFSMSAPLVTVIGPTGDFTTSFTDPV